MSRIPFGHVLFLLSVLWFGGAVRAIEPPAPEAVDERFERLLAGQLAPEGKADLLGLQQRFREIAERVLPCTVGVQLGGGSGSGVIVSPDGYVLTAAHVSGKPGRGVTLVLQSGRRVNGKTLGANFGIDAGLIKIDGDERWPYVDLGRSGPLKAGAWCLATGHPGGFQAGRTSPIRVGRVLNNPTQGVVTDCMLVGGDSGGPLFDMQGQVIGIHSRIGDSLAANIHVPVDAYLDGWERLVKGESWGDSGDNGPKKGDPFLGVSGDPSTSTAKLAAVHPNSPAEKAGLQVGDVVTRFAGKEIKDYGSLVTAVRAAKAGQEVEIEILRGETKKSLKVTLGRFGDSSVWFQDKPNAEKPEEKKPEEKKPEDKKPDAQPSDAEKQAEEQKRRAEEEKKKAEDEKKKAEEQKKAEEKKKQEAEKKRQEEEKRKQEEKAFLNQLDVQREREAKRVRGANEKNHDSIRKAFRDSVQPVRSSTAVVLGDGVQVALGTVVAADGLLLTKASELRGKLEVKLPDGKATAAEVVGVNEPHDLALLKIARGGLTPVSWAEHPPLPGSWLATPGPSDLPLSVGVVSVAARSLRPRGVLGVSLKLDADRALVEQVLPGSAAAKAGLQPNDVITRLEGQLVETSQKLMEMLQNRLPGDKVQLQVRRGEEERDVTATLGSIPGLPADRQSRFDRMNLLGGELSTRRTNFPSALQHDTILRPEDCGGPLVDLDGQVVGLNIARSGRIESYAIPTPAVLALLEDLRAGRSAPGPEFRQAMQLRAVDFRLSVQERELRSAERAKAELEKKIAQVQKSIDQSRQQRAEIEKKKPE